MKGLQRGYGGFQGVTGDNKGGQEITMGYKGYQGVTMGYRLLQGATGCHSGLRGVTGDYTVLQKTSSLTRTSPDTFSWSILHERVTKGLWGLSRSDRG